MIVVSKPSGDVQGFFGAVIKPLKHIGGQPLGNHPLGKLPLCLALNY